MNEVLIVGDLHIQPHTLHLYDVLWEKLKQAEYVILCGDIVHNRKTYTPEFLLQLRDIFFDIAEHVEMSILVGNHDILYTDQYGTHRTVLEMFSHPHIDIVRYPKKLFLDNRVFYLLPYYDPENFPKWEIPKADVLITHTPVVLPSALDWLYNHVPLVELDLSKYEWVFQAHFHAVEIAPEQRVIVTGSIAPTSRVEQGDGHLFYLNIDNLEVRTERILVYKYTNTNEYKERFDNERTIIVTSNPDLCDQYQNVMKCLYVPPNAPKQVKELDKSTLWEDVKSILQDYFDADSFFWETLPGSILEKLRMSKEGKKLPSPDLNKYEHVLNSIHEKLSNL